MSKPVLLHNEIRKLDGTGRLSLGSFAEYIEDDDAE